MFHTKNEINHFLQRSFFAVMTFSNGDGLSSHLTIFANSKDGEFYLVSRSEKNNFNAIKNNTPVSILICKEEEELDDIREVQISGVAEIINENDQDNIKVGYEYLGSKSPYLGNLIYDHQDRMSHTLIKVNAEKLSYTTIGEIKSGIKPTIIKKVNI